MSRAWRKSLISVVIVAHLLAVGLRNMPDRKSRRWFYDWYIGLTGQLQGWSMFSKTGPLDTRIELAAQFSDGSKAYPFGQSKAWSGAVLDIVTDALASETSARAFFEALRATYPKGASPKELRLILLHRPIARLGSSTPAQASDFVVTREFNKKW